MKKEKILIVDDDEGVRSLYHSILNSAQYQIFSAENGPQGLEVLAREEVDLVILDLQMPRMNGFEFLSALKERLEELPPVIVSTGLGTIENAVQAIKHGAVDFVTKPFDVSTLRQVVERNLKIKSLAQELSELRMVQAILELNQTIISLTKLSPLLDRIGNLVWDLFAPDSFLIYLDSEDSDSFILRQQKFRGEPGRSLKVSYSRHEVREIFQESEIRLRETEGRQEIAVLISGKRKDIGLLQLNYAAGRKKVNPREIRFMKTFVSQASIGIENARLFEKVSNAHMNAIRSLVNSLEAKDPCTKGHSEQVAYYAVLLGKKLGLVETQLETLRDTAYLHDLGKLGIKDSILLKTGPLSPEEMEMIKQHPLTTVKILEPLQLREEEIAACLYHHEKMDGNGYPKGLKGEDIPLFARIIAIADAYSAMISERPYSKTMTPEEAGAELKANAGTQFDAALVDVFMEALPQKKVPVI